MKKYITVVTVFLMLTFSAFSQTRTLDSLRIDSIQKVRMAVDKFVDSLAKKTTIAEFQAWLYENVTGKNAQEGKFADLYSAFINKKYTEWISTKLQAIGASGTSTIIKQKPK